MRIVRDTNVLVSAIVFGGPPAQLIELAAEDRLQLVLSPPLTAELRDVLRRKFGFSDAAAYQAEALLRAISMVVEPEREVAVLDEDRQRASSTDTELPRGALRASLGLAGGRRPCGFSRRGHLTP